jgi:hypothetical protein
MFTKIMQWVSITALLLAVMWRPSSNYQVLLHLLVCAGAVMVALALFSIKNTKSRLSIASITDPAPRGESL